MFRKDNCAFLDGYEDGVVYKPDSLACRDMREVEKAFARLFSSDDGLRVLAHLRSITFERALGAGAADAQLRYVEGQRALLAEVLRLVDRGKNPN